MGGMTAHPASVPGSPPYGGAGVRPPGLPLALATIVLSLVGGLIARSAAPALLPAWTVPLMILAALALAVIAARRPDAVLLDLRMPGGDGLETLRALPPGSAGRPRFLVLTTYDTDRDIRSALRAGADGFLLKDAPRSVLQDACTASRAASPSSLRGPSA